MKKQDDIFKELASKYTEIDGKMLRDQLIEVEKENQINISRGLDNSIYQKIRNHKSKKYITRVGQAAACLLIMFLSGYLFNHIIADTPQNFDTVEYSGNLQSVTGDVQNSNNDTIIRLTATLPENFSISNVEQDNGETIYYIVDANKDNVILSICKSDDALDTEGLKQINIDGTPVYVLTKNDYTLLKFKKDGNVYILTCKYDINTLIEIGESII